MVQRAQLLIRPWLEMNALETRHYTTISTMDDYEHLLFETGYALSVVVFFGFVRDLVRHQFLGRPRSFTGQR